MSTIFNLYSNQYFPPFGPSILTKPFVEKKVIKKINIVPDVKPKYIYHPPFGPSIINTNY